MTSFWRCVMPFKCAKTGGKWCHNMLREGESASDRWNDICMSRSSRSGWSLLVCSVLLCVRSRAQERHLGVKAARWKACAETWGECVWESGKRERETDTVYLSSNRLTLCGMALFDTKSQSKQSARAVNNHHALGFCLPVNIWVLNVRREARIACKCSAFSFAPLK